MSVNVSSQRVIFTQRPLYGGSMTVFLPQNYIDASDFRQIPDHQEVFMSLTALTSIIFEINAYQMLEDTTTTTASSDYRIDEMAAIAAYHFNDPIQPPDHLKEEPTVPSPLLTQPVTLKQPSVSRFPCSITTGTIITSEVKPGTSSARILSETRVYQLLVRIQKHETDFCIRLNVPLKEYTDQIQQSGGDPRQIAEVTLAESMLTHIVESLDIKDFGLFGTESE